MSSLYIGICIILHGKLKEAATKYKSHVHRGAPVILVVSYGTTRLLSNSPGNSHSRSFKIVVAISNRL